MTAFAERGALGRSLGFEGTTADGFYLPAAQSGVAGRFDNGGRAANLRPSYRTGTEPVAQAGINKRWRP